MIDCAALKGEEFLLLAEEHRLLEWMNPVAHLAHAGLKQTVTAITTLLMQALQLATVVPTLKLLLCQSASLFHSARYVCVAFLTVLCTHQLVQTLLCTTGAGQQHARHAVPSKAAHACLTADTCMYCFAPHCDSQQCMRTTSWS
jgi:hypothetical protein